MRDSVHFDFFFVPKFFFDLSLFSMQGELTNTFHFPGTWQSGGPMPPIPNPEVDVARASQSFKGTTPSDKAC